MGLFDRFKKSKNKPGAEVIFKPIADDGLICDVCNSSIEDGGYYVPNKVFYSSEKYRKWLLEHNEEIENSSELNDFISSLEVLDNSEESAVCKECIHLFK